MMKWLGLVTLALAVVIAVVVIVGVLLPRNHRASREQMVASSPYSVWAAITGIEAFPSWRTDVEKIQKLPDRDGRMAWIEEGVSGKLTFVAERLDPPRVFVTRLADPDLPFGGTWTYNLEPVGEATRVTITEDGEIYNPVFRFMSRFIFGYEATMRTYLSALEKRFPAKPVLRSPEASR